MRLDRAIGSLLFLVIVVGRDLGSTPTSRKLEQELFRPLACRYLGRAGRAVEQDKKSSFAEQARPEPNLGIIGGEVELIGASSKQRGLPP